MINITLFDAVLTGLGVTLLVGVGLLADLKAKLDRLSWSVRRLQREQQKLRIWQSNHVPFSERRQKADLLGAPWERPLSEELSEASIVSLRERVPYEESDTHWLIQQCGERFYDDLGNLYETTEGSYYDPKTSICWAPARLVRPAADCRLRGSGGLAHQKGGAQL